MIRSGWIRRQLMARRMHASLQLGEVVAEKGISERVARRAEQASGVAADIRALSDGDALKRLRSDWSRQ